MSAVNEIQEAFELFNEKVDKLTRLSFIKSMLEKNAGVTLSWEAREGGGFIEKHERRGPQEEAIDAFVLTFRYFIQDNEINSLRRMADHYNSAPVDSPLKKEFASIRKQINDYLDAESHYHIEWENDVLTRRKIMNVFVYGGMAHATDLHTKQISDNKRLYDLWMTIPPLRPLLENEFVSILAHILDALVYIKSLNERALSQLKSAGGKK